MFIFLTCLIVPAKPDYLSTIGIEQLKKHVNQLVNDYNSKIDFLGSNDFEKISPKFEGVVFTMTGIRNNQPILAQQQYISQIRRLSIPTMVTIIRDNKTLYADAPQEGIPVVLENANPGTYKTVREELENLVNETSIMLLATS